MAKSVGKERREKKKFNDFFVPAINFCTEHRKKIDDDSVYTQNIHALKLWLPKSNRFDENFKK